MNTPNKHRGKERGQYKFKNSNVGSTTADNREAKGSDTLNSVKGGKPIKRKKNVTKRQTTLSLAIGNTSCGGCGLRGSLIKTTSARGKNLCCVNRERACDEEEAIKLERRKH